MVVDRIRLNGLRRVDHLIVMDEGDQIGKSLRAISGCPKFPIRPGTVCCVIDDDERTYWIKKYRVGRAR